MVGASLPLYVEIADALRRQVRKSHVGAPLPSETELAAQFGVSRMTARQAVKAVEAEGLLYRVPGRGTFASGGETHRAMGELRSFTSEMREKGMSVRSEVIDAGWVELDAPGSAVLQLSPGTRAVRVTRVRFADDIRMATETATLTPRCSFILDHDLGSSSVHELLEERGIVPTEAFGTLVACAATAEDAERLAVEVGSPMLVERRRINDQHGTRIENTETRYAGSHYVFDVHLSRPGPS